MTEPTGRVTPMVARWLEPMWLRFCSALRRSSQVLLGAGAATLLLLHPHSLAQSLSPAPGGFLEKASSKVTRPRLTQSQILSFLPPRGKFTFPAPYNTTGIYLTNPSDCGGADCVNYVGYSYWRNMNNHVGSDTMYIFLGLDKSRGGGGPTLFSYNKVTDEVKKLGPLFSSSNPYSNSSGHGWYFSATHPTKLYVYAVGPQLQRYDVLTKTFETVFDVSAKFGADKYIAQANSSNDDRTHVAILRQMGTWAMLGCVVYKEDAKQFLYYPQKGKMDECHLDKSGRWLIMLDDVDGRYEIDQRIIDLTGAIPERIILDQDGGVGHADEGYGYTVGANNYNAEGLRNAITLYQYDVTPIRQTTVSYNTDWSVAYANHVSHSNAKPNVPPAQQYACGSNASRHNGPRGNEIVCFRLDTSEDVLVVADVMTDLTAPDGRDDYAKMPKGNLDVTGQYFIWTSNMGGNRLDAFLVKVPAQLLMTTSQPLSALDHAMAAALHAPIIGKAPLRPHGVKSFRVETP